MRRFGILLLVLALLLAGCGNTGEGSSSSSGSQSSSSSSSSQEEKNTQPFTLAAYPAYSFHPALSTSQANLTLAPLLYESLFTVDSTFTATPQLCQSYTVSEDGLTWTLQLRAGVTFSDGTPLTGEIVAQALQTAKDPASRYAKRLANVNGVSGSGDQVTITLTVPNGALPTLLDIPIALDSSSRPLGTGPYVLSEQNGKLYLNAREDWWQGADSLSIKQIPLATMTQKEQVGTAFNSGEVTLIDADITGSNELGYSGSYEVWEYNTTGLIYLGFQTAHRVCQKAEVRQAIAKAIDRSYVTDNVYARHATAATLPVHPDSALYDTELAQELEYDLSALKALGLEGKSLTLLVNIEDMAKSAAANRIEEDLESAGLRVTVERLAWEDYVKALERGQFDLYLAEVYLTADFDLTSLISPQGELNYGGWNDAAVPGLLDNVRRAQGDERVARMTTLLRYLNQNAPIAPICFREGTVLTQYDRVENLSPVQGNVFSNLSQWTVK